MATPPVFSAGAVLTAAQMNAVGMWLVKTDTITSGSSKEITSAFTSDFQNYRIVISNVKMNTSARAISFQFGTVATGYYGTYYYDQFDGAATGTVRANNGAALRILTATNLASAGAVIEVYSPQATADQKSISGNSYGDGLSAWFGGTLNSATSRTSFTLTSDGTFVSCNIYVYGYRK